MRAGGIDIAYDVHGVGARGTVLLVCGTGQPAAMWGALGTTDALTGAGYQVVTFDNRGMAGAACPAPPWTVGDIAEAVPDGRYVETPGVSHASIDPDSLQLQMTALLEFLADR